VIALGVSPTVFAWTLRRDIPGVPDLATLADYAGDAATLGIITRPELIPALAREYAVEQVQTKATQGAYRLLRMHRRKPP